MHSSLDREELIQLVKEFAEPQWIGIIGMPRIRLSSLQSQVISTLLCSMKEAVSLSLQNMRIVERRLFFTPPNPFAIYDHPEWFDTQWLWELAKFSTAETLYGDCSMYPVTPKARLIAILGMAGHVLISEQKQGRSRIMADGDNALPLLALRHLVDETFPRNRDALQDGMNLEYVDEARSWLESALVEFLPDVLFYPQHYNAACWLNERWQLNLTMPIMGTLH